MAAKKVHVFVTGTVNSHFVCNGTDRHEIREKNVNRCAVLNLDIEEF